MVFVIIWMIYIYKVTSEEITSIFAISTKVIYKGYQFGVMSEKEDQLLLFTGNYDAYKQLKMDVAGKCEYEKWVDKKDIDRVWEVRNLWYNGDLVNRRTYSYQ